MARDLYSKQVLISSLIIPTCTPPKLGFIAQIFLVQFDCARCCAPCSTVAGRLASSRRVGTSTRCVRSKGQTHRSLGASSRSGDFMLAQFVKDWRSFLLVSKLHQSVCCLCPAFEQPLGSLDVCVSWFRPLVAAIGAALEII